MLKEEIEKKRKEMIIAVNKNGLSSNTVVRLSQELDVLIYKYQKLKKVAKGW